MQIHPHTHAELLFSGRRLTRFKKRLKREFTITPAETARPALHASIWGGVTGFSTLMMGNMVADRHPYVFWGCAASTCLTTIATAAITGRLLPKDKSPKPKNSKKHTDGLLQRIISNAKNTALN